MWFRDKNTEARVQDLKETNENMEEPHISNGLQVEDRDKKESKESRAFQTAEATSPSALVGCYGDGCGDKLKDSVLLGVSFPMMIPQLVIERTTKS